MKRTEIGKILFDKLYMVEPYPKGVTPVRKLATETAFFPGGYGVWMENNTDILPDIMVIGQDFSLKEQHEKILTGITHDIDTNTWKEIIKLFKEVGIPLCRCFFTNSMMGLRESGSNTGIFIGLKDDNYLKRNISFLENQIELVKPSLIIVLGSIAPKVISNLSEKLKIWKDFNFKKIDNDDLAIQKNIYIKNISINFVSIVHPSFRFINSSKRKYKSFIGNEAEIQLLKDAYKEIETK